jgi:selenocysteine lyase/cysteine desulfurase
MKTTVTALEKYFAHFGQQVIGNQQFFETPFGKKEILYADWTASGRAYRPIEECIQKEILPFAANTHTEANITGTLMSNAYEQAKKIVKQHVNAGSDDVLIFCGSGMTAAVSKLQRILGLRLPERMMDYFQQDNFSFPVPEDASKPVVFITHMEHHSNHISWLETIASVEIIPPDENGNVDLAAFRALLEKYKHRNNKIAAITACSNVTGIQTPYREIATLIHAFGGVCFVDFACSAPYSAIDMHPVKGSEGLDAIYFSPHKFLGGPGSAGVLVFNKKMYSNKVPDQPGGGTILYSNPWKLHVYNCNIEQREDGGTPPFLQGIRVAMCIRLKEAMGVEKMLQREKEMLEIIFKRFTGIKNIEVLQGNHRERLGVVSFIADGADHNLFVKLLNDRFGVQARGGCSCAGTYGHLLLKVDQAASLGILKRINSGDFRAKPGWIRISVHPVMTSAAINRLMDAIEKTAAHYPEWKNDYSYDEVSNEYVFKGEAPKEQNRVADWFNAARTGNLPKCQINEQATTYSTP